MAIVGLLAVGMTTPATAVAAVSGSPISAPVATSMAGDVAGEPEQIQAYVVPTQTQNVAVERSENYQIGTMADLAADSGISNYSDAFFQTNPNCAVQWPFAVGVSISYGFGFRSGRMHEGVDFTPGEGAHVLAIADGVVRDSTDSGGAYGVAIVIDHVVDGQQVSTRYGHMEYGSRQVQVGDTVTAGEFIGLTGDTGRSFGAHTHVEILDGGDAPIDPLTWLDAHATC